MPPFAKQHGIHGVVTLDAKIDDRGRVTGITPVSGDPVLVQAARQAVLKWRFEPAMVNRKPVPGQVAVRLVFGAGR
jgi:TonB family protein